MPFISKKNDPELYAYRRGLHFAFFNALNWQVAVGTPTVLFMEHLGANPFEVGLVFAWTFLLTPAQVVATTLLPRLGFKKLTLLGWGARGWFLLVPLGLSLYAPESRVGWSIYSMVTAMFFYSLSRAVGAAAITSWLYGLVPASIRGRYWSTDQMMGGIAAVGTLAVCALLFAVLPPYWAFTIQYLIAIFGAWMALRCLGSLPDVERPKTMSLRYVASKTPKLMFQPGAFRYYLWVAVLFFVVTTPIGPFTAFYLKSSVGLGAWQIMLFTMLQYLGVIAGNWFMRSRTDRVGAKPFLRLSFSTYAVIGAGWWCYLHAGGWMGAALPVLYFLVGVGAGCFTTSNLNFLAKNLPEGDRALAVAVHSAITAFLGGFSPALWGFYLRGSDGKSLDLAAFEIFFICTVVGAVALLLLSRRLTEKTGHVKPLLEGSWLLRPFRAMTYLINLVEEPAPQDAKAPARDVDEQR
ncbi:MAG: MFS transporter [Candidatus Didemnitutus sp.]|nr:MFS transporter [Candidatus Didemnitutus sp.]